MGTNKNFKSILGIQQEEIALLLGISRSHWSLYELGKRTLPTPIARIYFVSSRYRVET